MSRIDNAAEGVGQAADRIRDKAAEVSHQVQEVASQKYEEVRGKAAEVYNQGKHAAEEWEKTLEDYIHEKPLQAVAIAAGAGLLLGLLWKRS